jgi:hypothetical protein
VRFDPFAPTHHSSSCLIDNVVIRYTFVIGAIVIAIAFEIDGLTNGPFHALCLLLSLATTNNIVLMYILSFFVDDPVMMQVSASAHTRV